MHYPRRRWWMWKDPPGIPDMDDFGDDYIYNRIDWDMVIPLKKAGVYEQVPALARQTRDIKGACLTLLGWENWNPHGLK